MADGAEDVVDAMADERDIQIIREVLAHLGDRDQEVIALCVLEGLSPQSVAIALGEPATTIRSRLSRALGRARGLYATYTNELVHRAKDDR